MNVNVDVNVRVTVVDGDASHGSGSRGSKGAEREVEKAMRGGKLLYPYK